MRDAHDDMSDVYSKCCISYPKPGKKKKKKRGLSYSKLKKVYAEVLDRDGYICQNPHCLNGFPIDPPHHIVKRSQYGLDEPKNLITLCTECHGKIHNTGELKVSGIYPALTWTEKK